MTPLLPWIGLALAASFGSYGLVNKKATVVTLLLFATAVERIPLSLIGILQYIAPTIQFLLGVFACHEPFTRTRLTGFGLIWSVLIVFTFDSVRPRSSASLTVADEGAR